MRKTLYLWKLDILEFKEMSDEWLDFIVTCRSGQPHNHDIVIGAMENDQIYNYVADYIDGIITREQFWMLAWFKNPIMQALSAENPEHDGKQTPMKGHPVFLAQHATACCCRSCLEKWRHIPAGKILTESEQSYIVDVLMQWIEAEMNR